MSCTLMRCLVTRFVQPDTKCLTAAIITSQVRYKTMNKSRYRAPNVAKEKTRRFGQRKQLAPFENTQDPTDESFWLPEPVDDVWIKDTYPIQHYSLHEAIKRHQEYAQPSMFNCLDAVVYADLSINMATAKKTKFVKPVKETILLPHQFTYKDKNQCIVFCQSEEEIQCALDHGAIYAGSEKLIRMFEDDTITREDYDFVLATPDMLAKIVSLRSKLRDHFPSEKQGTMGGNIADMVSHYTHGISLESKETTSEAVNRLQAPLGQLGMTIDQLTENFQHYVTTLGIKRPSKAVGQMILQAFLIAPPSKEMFFLRESELAYSRPKMRRVQEEVEEEVIEEAEAS